MRHQRLHIKVLITVLLFKIILVPFLNGQSMTKVDSLINSLVILKEDTHKVNALVELSRQYLMLQNPQRASEYLKDGLALGEHLQFKPGIMRGINMEGNIFYVQRRYDEAISKYLSSLQIAKSLNNKTGIAKGCINLGNAYNALGQGGDALRFYEEAYQLSIETNQPDITVAAERNSANILLNQGDYKYALEKYNRLISIQHKAGNEQGFADAHHSAGICSFFLGDLSKALEHYFIALKIREEKKDPGRLGDSYNDIANVYRDEEQYEIALDYYQKALSFFEATGNQQRVSVTYNNLGNLYARQLNFGKALENYEASTRIKERLGDKSGLIVSYNNLANFYLIQKNPERAIRNLEVAQQLSKELNDKAGLASTCLNLGRAHADINKYNEARIYITDAISTFKEIGSKIHLHSGYNFLSKLDSMEGNMGNAMANYKLAILYKDSLFNEERAKMMANLQLSYETEKKDNEIQKLTNEKQISSLQLALQEENLRLLEAERGRLHSANLFNLQQVDLLDREKQLQALELEKKEASNLIQQSEIEKNISQLALMNKESEIQRMEIKKQRLLKNYFMGGILLFGFLSFFAYNYYVTKQKLKLQVLRNKIASDLHDDVGSTLSSISIFSEIAKEQSKETIPMLETIGESSRKMLDAMADIVWTINPENDQLERILIKMRSFAYELLGAKKIAFKFTADDHISNIKLPMEVRKNLYLIFKEAANNMAKYSGADKAFFSLKEEKGYLTMMIRDNGKGFDPVEETTGNGIKNMRKRAEEIRALLRINSSPGEGTFIELKVAI